MGRIPCVTIHAYCDSPEVAAAIELASSDRRMSRAHVSVRTGGVNAAVRSYQRAPTPELILIESREPADNFLGQLDDLAAVCDIATRIVAIGVSNDIRLYRELIARGVSEYLLAPVDPAMIIAAVSRVFSKSGTQALGKVYAFLGAKGGVGSSTIAHNVAWTIGQRYDSDVLLIDMDMAFGTAGLNLDQDPVNGIADAITEPGRLDQTMLDRLLTKCGERVNLLAAPTALDRPYDLSEEAFDPLLDLARSNFPHVVLDIPHLWTSWSKRMLFIADEVVITAVPDLPNLASTKHLVDTLSQMRPLDSPPKVVLNQVGALKRPEINAKEFTETLQLGLSALIASDPKLFGNAANMGQLISETAKRSRASQAFGQLAQALTQRKPLRSRSLRGLDWLFRRAQPNKSATAKKEVLRDAS
jgi:pilus assembly protein CpaE